MDDWPIPVFVTPYPDECVYSILCRCNVRAAYSSARFILEMFGRQKPLDSLLYRPFKPQETRRWPMDQPFHLVSRIENSCAAYWAPFLSDYDSSLMGRWLCGEELTVGQYKRLTRSFGYNTWKKERLCYCPECAREEREVYGEAYWHRLPQLPGVWCCPEHQVPLNESMISRIRIRYELFPAEYVLRGSQAGTPVSSCRSSGPMNQRISENSEWLLRNGLVISRERFQSIQYAISSYELPKALEDTLRSEFTAGSNLSRAALTFLYKLEAQGIKSIKDFC